MFRSAQGRVSLVSSFRTVWYLKRKDKAVTTARSTCVLSVSTYFHHGSFASVCLLGWSVQFASTDYLREYRASLCLSVPLYPAMACALNKCSCSVSAVPLASPRNRTFAPSSMGCPTSAGSSRPRQLRPWPRQLRPTTPRRRPVDRSRRSATEAAARMEAHRTQRQRLPWSAASRRRA